MRSNAAQRPDSVALLAPGAPSLTYGQLDEQVDYVGRALRQLRVERSDRVAVVLPNGPEMAAAFLGVGACATCAPLNPSYGHDEFLFYLTDLAAKAIVLPADQDLPARDVAARLGLTVMELESSPTKPAGAFALRGALKETESPVDTGNDDDIALVLHTSGTTSRPKQVPLSQRNLLTSATNIANVLKLSPADRCLNVMPLFHIHGLIGVLLSSIFSGGSVICSAGYRDDEFQRLLRGFQPTWYSAVPTIHQSVLALMKKDPTAVAAAQLRLIRSSSSSLPPTVMLELEKAFGVPVIESYGMTEAAHQMASNPLPPADRKPGSVGLPAGPEMAIMDDGGTLLPAGETGEIVIRGANVTSGYANNAEANADAFTDGWFRTGDRGRTDSDGYFYITGRTKEMINRGGENISPREIDEVLLEHPAVDQAVAFAVPHASLGEDVAAAVVLRGGAEASEQDLRDFAFSKLADFKVPSKIAFVDAIPKGPTGKLQRIGLYEKLRPLLEAEYVAPVGEVESKMADLWAELLELPRVGRDDNFFACGGDSLLATSLAARVRADLNVELSLPAIFQQPLLHAQAALVDEALQATQESKQHEMAAMLKQLDNLSDEEAARLLAKEQPDLGPAGGGDQDLSERT